MVGEFNDFDFEHVGILSSGGLHVDRVMFLVFRGPEFSRTSGVFARCGRLCAPRVASRRSSTPDQGSRFTRADWISGFQVNDIQISMDGQIRWMDNVFIKRYWRSLKVEKLRLWSYGPPPELRALTTDLMEFHNHRRKHQTLGYGALWSVYGPPLSNAA